MDNSRIIERIDKLLKEVNLARSASPHDDLSGGLPAYQLAALGLRLKTCIVGIVSNDSVYFDAIKEIKGDEGRVVNGYAAILEALRSDIKDGYFDQTTNFDLFNTNTSDEDAPFSKQEAEILNERLTNIENYLIDHAAQSEQQKNDIHAELAWLKEELHKSDKKTWERIFAGTILTKIVDWGLSPEHLSTVYHQLVIQGSKLLK